MSVINRTKLITDIRIKMDADIGDASDDYYENYYNSLIDECLSVVANTVLPYQRVATVTWGGWTNTTKDLDKTCYYTVESEFKLPNGQIAKRKDWIEYKNDEWHVQKRNNYGYLMTLPHDLLSFSDEGSNEYYNLDGDMLLDPNILYINSRTLALPKDGTYKIWYNSEYPSIYDNADNLEYIPTNVLKIIPTYVAAQLLMSEDPIKATQFKNEFELMLARIDDNKPLQSYNITNNSGWTY